MRQVWVGGLASCVLACSPAGVVSIGDAGAPTAPRDAASEPDGAEAPDGGSCDDALRLVSTAPGNSTLYNPANMVVHLEAIGLAHLPITAIQSSEDGTRSTPLEAASLGPDMFAIPRKDIFSDHRYRFEIPSKHLSFDLVASVHPFGPIDNTPPTFTSSLSLSWGPSDNPCFGGPFMVLAEVNRAQDAAEFPGAPQEAQAYVLWEVVGGASNSIVGAALPRFNSVLVSIPARTVEAGHHCYVASARDVAGNETLDPAVACIDVGP